MIGAGPKYIELSQRLSASFLFFGDARDIARSLAIGLNSLVRPLSSSHSINHDDFVSVSCLRRPR